MIQKKASKTGIHAKQKRKEQRQKEWRSKRQLNNWISIERFSEIKMEDTASRWINKTRNLPWLASPNKHIVFNDVQSAKIRSSADYLGEYRRRGNCPPTSAFLSFGDVSLVIQDKAFESPRAWRRTLKGGRRFDSHSDLAKPCTKDQQGLASRLESFIKASSVKSSNTIDEARAAACMT